MSTPTYENVLGWYDVTAKDVRLALGRTIKFFNAHPDRWITGYYVSKSPGKAACFCAVGRFGKELNASHGTGAAHTIIALLGKRMAESTDPNDPWYSDLKVGHVSTINDHLCDGSQDVVRLLEGLKACA